jgi:hypothetical protein
VAEKHDDTTIITTERQIGSGAGWFFVGAFIAIGIAVGYFYLDGRAADDDVSITVDLPNIELPATQ